MCWLSVALATRRFEPLKNSELLCGSRRGLLRQRVDRGYERYLWSTTRLGCKPCTDTEWACEKKPPWISCGAGEHFLVSLRAGNERQPSEGTPLRWDRCGHRLRRGVLMESVFCGNSLGLIRCDMYWVGIGQRGTWHETGRWVLVDTGRSGPESCGFSDGVVD